MQSEKAGLLLIATAPVAERDGGLYLDKKFVEGMRLHAKMWENPITCILRRGNLVNPFGALYKADELGFDLSIIDSDERISERHLAGFGIALCPADAHDTLHLSAIGKSLGVKIVYTVEYTIGTRLQIAALDLNRGFARRTYSMAWNIVQEYRRRKAIRLADGLQTNGYPAAKAYRAINANMTMYIDNRLKPGMFATDKEMEAKANRLTSGAPLRLINSGRLERMKGAHDLLPVALALRERGVDFTMSIYGDGSLRTEIMDGIRKHELAQVTLHDPVDFETELVSVNRTQADIFLSCHKQSDPSCTYIESLGCGVPVIGYDNEMWSALRDESDGGWMVEMGNIAAMADTIADLSSNRNEISRRANVGLAFARAHDFVTEFQRRMDHAYKTLTAK